MKFTHEYDVHVRRRSIALRYKTYEQLALLEENEVIKRHVSFNVDTYFKKEDEIRLQGICNTGKVENRSTMQEYVDKNWDSIKKAVNKFIQD